MSDIIDKIKSFSKNAKKNISKYLDLNVNYNISSIQYNNSSMIAITHNNKEILVGDYKYFGEFRIKQSMWVWGNAIVGVNKKVLEDVKKIRSFSHLFEGKSKNQKRNQKRMDFYYQLLTSDSLLLSSQIELEWINELVLYLSGDIFWFNPETSNGIQVITLSKIIEKYI